MSYEELFNLKSNPFRLTPAINSSEIIWAGFPEIKSQFESRIKRTLKISNSSLILNWGEYGSGKTHAARFFGKKEELEKLSREVERKVPFFVLITLPKGKSPIDDFFTSIIDKVDLTDLRVKFKDSRENIFEFIDVIGDNVFINNVTKLFFNDEVNENLLRRYLYGSTNAEDTRNLVAYGIQRKLNPDTDYAKLLAMFFSCITYNEKNYSSVILWIDEFEDIAILSKSNGDKTNSFLRELLDNTPNNLLVFLNLTQSALFNIEDLGEYISEALKSRIKARINFELPSKEELFIYVKELLDAHHVDSEINKDKPYFPFTKEVIEEVIEKLGSVSLRKFNEAFGLLIELAEMDEKSPIEVEYFEVNKNEIIGWKE